MLVMIQQHLADIIVGLVVIALLILAVHHIVKHPGCSECGKKGGCSGCGGGCSSCSDPVDFAKMKEAVEGTHSK